MRKKNLDDKVIKERIRSSWDGDPERYNSAHGFDAVIEMEVWKSSFFSREF